MNRQPMVGNAPRRRRLSEGRRFVVAVMAGLLAAAVSVPLTIWQLTLLIGWIVTAAVYLVSVLRDVRGLDAPGTAANSTVEDNSRSIARLLVVGSAMASLVGVLVALARANGAAPGLKAVLTVASVLTIVASWAVVHCIYMLRYAHQYYSEPVGGVDFPGDDEPAYREFAYLAYTVGMTYQVADTDITSPGIRRTLLTHALISYLFGAVIVAVAINVVAGLV